MLPRALRDEPLVPTVGLKIVINTIVGDVDVNACLPAGFVFSVYHLIVITNFCGVQRWFLAGIKFEQDSPHHISFHPGMFDIPFARMVSAYLVESEAIAFQEKLP
jgi:hypothetical protein